MLDVHQNDQRKSCAHHRVIYFPLVYNSMVPTQKGIEPPCKMPGGGGGTQIWFRRGCAAEAAKPIPIFKGHYGGKGYLLLRVWRKRVPIIRGFY